MKALTTWGMKPLALFALVLVLFGTAGCEKLANMIGKKASQQLEKDIDESTKEASKKSKKSKSGSSDDGDDKGKGDNGGSAAKVNYFDDATNIPKLYKAKVGPPTRVLELLIYPNYGYAQIQDPKKPENVDQYDERDGNVQDGAPVKFMGHQPTAADIKEDTFDIDEVDFGAVAKMVKDAPVQLKIDDGKTTHIILKRPLPFSKDVRFRVYVNGARKDGSVEYDAKGVMKKTY